MVSPKNTKDKQQAGISDITLQPRPPVVVVLGHVDHGKCVAPSTSIPLVNGEILNAQDIWEKYKKEAEIRSYKDEGYVAEIKNGPKIFSFDNHEIKRKRITHLWKLKASKQMIKIKLAPGDSIEVTPEHPFFVFNDKGEIRQKKAELIGKEDFIVVPQSIKFFQSNLIKTKTRLMEKLKELNNSVIFLDDNNKNSKQFLDKLKKTNKQDLYRKGFFSTNPINIFKYKRLRAKDFVKLSGYLGFSLSEVYGMISGLKNAVEKWHGGKSSNKIKLPHSIKDFYKLGYILGCLAGDGDLNRVALHNNDKEIQTTYSQYLKSVFRLETKITQGHTCQMVENNGGVTLRRFLTDIIGFPKKEKSLNIDIPFLVLSFQPTLKGFIEGLFDTDGYVSNVNRNYIIELSSKSKKMIKSLSIALLNFGIHSTIFSKNKYHYLKIGNNPYLQKFSNCFSLKHGKKKDIIKSICKKASTSRTFDLTPLSGKLLKSFCINERLLPYFSHYRYCKFLSRPLLKKLLSFKDKVELNKAFLTLSVKHLINPGEISCVKVKDKKIIKSSYKFVYDFTVPKTHNFVAERMIIHNTSILDYIRKSKVVEKESGGITQHIGAYQVKHQGKLITFIDTPGHEAFDKMRSRGAKVADIAVLVVAGEEGVREQTKEAIEHIKRAGIPMIVAINKIDKPQASPEKVKRELAKEDVLVESMGGKVPTVETSAVTGKGIDELLEIILLLAEMEDLKTSPSKLAEGVVIESHLDPKRGPTATLLLNEGRLKLGDIVATPSCVGKLKILENFQGETIKETFPSMPVVVVCFETPPQVGEKFKVFDTLEEAKEFSKKEKAEICEIPIEDTDKKSLNLILKVDVLGSLEAVKGVLEKLPQEKVLLRFLKGEVGEVNLSDVKTAIVCKARILAFRVKTNPQVQSLARQRGIKIMKFDVIYDIEEEIKKIMEKILEPEIIREDLGKVKVLIIFRTEKNRQIVGGKITEGEVTKGTLIEVWRDDEKVGKGKLVNLQRDKKDIDRLGKGQECGILFEGNVKIEEGDILVIYKEEKVKGEL